VKVFRQLPHIGQFIMKEKGYSDRSSLAVKDPACTVRILHACNFRCPSCSTFSGPERRGKLSLTDFSAAVDLLGEHGFRGQFHISGGETTLHPELDTMLSYAAGRLEQARICVFTNGHWVGLPGWRGRLRSFLAGPNVLIRFSLDRQHAEGEVRGRCIDWNEDHVRTSEAVRMEKARMFLQACREMNAMPGKHFDIAFKGSLEEGQAYTRGLDSAPLYLITFRPQPLKRPKEFGFFAIDVDEKNRPEVYPTLGHIPLHEPLGGLDTLATALEMNRKAIEDGDFHE
jgi:hypothetical protein